MKHQVNRRLKSPSALVLASLLLACSSDPDTKPLPPEDFSMWEAETPVQTLGQNNKAYICRYLDAWIENVLPAEESAVAQCLYQEPACEESDCSDPSARTRCSSALLDRCSATSAEIMRCLIDRTFALSDAYALTTCDALKDPALGAQIAALREVPVTCLDVQTTCRDVFEIIK